MTTLRAERAGEGLRAPAGRAVHRPSWIRRHRFQLLVLAPSVLLLLIFVYGFILYTGRVSLSQWQGIAPNLELQKPVGETYKALMETPHFQADLRNVIVYTVFFLALSIIGGLVL